MDKPKDAAPVPDAGEQTIMDLNPWADALHADQGWNEIPGHPGINPADDALEL